MFRILSQSDAGNLGARRGQLVLKHGVVETPAFMPVGTAGTVKAATFDTVEAAGAEIVLANTYHLMLRPGGGLIRRLGGLHGFTGWRGPILTDSGGFQVMSLAQNRKLTEEGVQFRSHIDGAPYLLTPETAVELQFRDFGVDIGMCLDECTPYPADFPQARLSMELTHRWAKRGRAAYERLRAAEEPGAGAPDAVGAPAAVGAQFGIVQGGMYEDLRRQSAEFIGSLGFEGVACGGVSVGEPKAEMRRIVEVTAPLLPAGRPRYLMGVGRPDDLVHAVASGFDMFDCVLPTRAARHGLAYTRTGSITIKNSRYREDPAPLDETCVCLACRRHSRAYLRHLFVLGEPSAAILLTQHNLTAILDLMHRIREALDNGCFADWARAFASSLEGKDS
ncbi:MAG: tRNA guanosine(34) transglycosylase Tgt [Acidobacteria bacterium]|nr:tRNA guanosine(34) transglycosylase Tgt [Acidobacteriota bacterium]